MASIPVSVDNLDTPHEGDSNGHFIRVIVADTQAIFRVLAEQVLLALPMKAICRSDCRGLCPQCGVNLNNEECRCESHAADPRTAPLARLKQDWFKKQ